jgi:hypothetical protein
MLLRLMKPLLSVSFASLLLLTTTACSMFGGDQPTKSVAPGAMGGAGKAAAEAPAFDIGKLLGGIKDGPTATAAKGPLEGAIAQLKNALAGAKAQSETAGAGASGADMATMAKKMANDVLTKFGISSQTVTTITSLLQNPAIASVIGPALDQLKGLIPAM